MTNDIEVMTHAIDVDGHEVVIVDVSWSGLVGLAQAQARAETVIDVLETVADYIVSVDDVRDWRTELPARVTGPVVRGVQDFFGTVLKPPASGDS